MPQAPYPDRIITLETISGLKVTHRREKNMNVFEFWRLGQSVTLCFTYGKARVFAEGVAFGRKITERPNER